MLLPTSLTVPWMQAFVGRLQTANKALEMAPQASEMHELQKQLSQARQDLLVRPHTEHNAAFAHSIHVALMTVTTPVYLDAVKLNDTSLCEGAMPRLHLLPLPSCTSAMHICSLLLVVPCRR